MTPGTHDETLQGPGWLALVREVQAIAQTGLTFAENPYDIERYQALRSVGARMAARLAEADPAAIADLFADQAGYATPKIDVRGAVFDARGRILMVREVQDGGRWTLPGGWADVNVSPAENVVKEVREESGFDVRVQKCAAVWDRSRQGHQPQFFSAFKLFFVCEIVGGTAQPSLETSEVAFFPETALPAELSTSRVLPHQLTRMFAHWRDPGLATEFD